MMDYWTGIGPVNRPQRRDPQVSHRCHLGSALIGTGAALHNGCDGRSYTPSFVGPGVPCICTCHRPPARP